MKIIIISGAECISWNIYNCLERWSKQAVLVEAHFASLFRVSYAAAFNLGLLVLGTAQDPSSQTKKTVNRLTGENKI